MTSHKMYKDRISKWGYHKNLKDVEKAAILRKQIQRSHAGKGSEAQIRNIHNLPSKLKRYRTKLNLRTDQQALALRAPTPPGLIFRTSSPKPSLRMPRELQGPEIVARAIQEYVCGMLDSGMWRITRTDIVLKMQNRDEMRGIKRLLLKFGNNCTHAMDDLWRKDYTHAFNWLNISMSMVEDIIKVQDPMAWSIICCALRQFCISENYRAIGYTILKHFAAMSTDLLEQSHPFNVLFDSLLHTESTTIGHNLTLGMRVAADIFTKKTGKFNNVSLDSYNQFAQSMGDTYQRIDFCSRLAGELRDTLGSNSLRYQDRYLDLAHVYLSVGKYQKAAEIAEIVVELRAAKSTDRSCRVLRLLASAQNGLGKTILAEKNMREAIRLSAEVVGWEDARTLGVISQLADWLEEWGRAEDAALVRAYHENILDTMFEKLHLEEEECFQKHGITDASVS